MTTDETPTANDKPAVINFDTTRENKNRWVHAAKKAGKKLPQWITDVLNANSEARK